MPPVSVLYPVTISLTTVGNILLTGRGDFFTLDIPTLLHDQNLMQEVFPKPAMMLDMLQWEQMCKFHALYMGWLASLSTFLTKDTMFNPSILVKMMFQPTLDKPWQQTYTWTDQWNGIHSLDGPTPHDWYSLNKSLSTSMWNIRPCNGYPRWRHRMGAHQHQLDGQCQPQSCYASTPYMDLGNNGTLTQSHQPPEGLLTTQGVFPASNWLHSIHSPCPLP